MGRIEISSQPPAGMWITHDFWYNHMPQASGDFCQNLFIFFKVERLHRQYHLPSSAADTFCMTENDIVRALRWNRVSSA